MSFFKRFKDYLFYTYHHLIIDSSTRKFINLLEKKYKPKYVNKKTKEIILVDFFDYFPFIFYWAEISNILNNKYGFKIKYFYFYFYNSFLAKNSIFLRKRKKIFNAFNCEEIATDINIKIDSLKKKKILDSFYKKIKGKKKNIINYTIKGIRVGDLIYDTFLRTKSSRSLATISDLNDPYLQEVVIRANIIFEKMSKIFSFYKVKIVMPSHSCYIQYGITVRIADKFKVPTLYLYKKGLSGKEIYLLRKKFNDVYDNLPYHSFKKIFAKIPINQKQEYLKIANKMIKNRFRGKRDNYMRKFKFHPYNKNSDFNQKKMFNKNKKNFIIFAHCFFDTSHNFRYMIFPDFYEWMIQTISIIRLSKNYQIYLKEHPFAQQGNREILKKIIEKNPDIIFLDKTFSNNLIIKSRPYMILTNHGSIGHEFAVKKIPVVNSGDNQHINYNFNLHAKNYNQYKDMILNFDKYKKKLNFDYQQICEFWYMRYFYFFNKIGQNGKILDNNTNIFRETNKLSNSSENLNYFNKNFNKNFNNIKSNFKNYLKTEKNLIKI